MKIFNRLKFGTVWMGCFLLVVVVSCSKTKIEPVEIYPDPPKALVKFLDGAPSPAIGAEGSIVTFNVNGLKDMLGKFKFFINQTEAEVVSADENTVKVKIPVNASSGGSAVLINNEYYFGPSFTVKGKVSVDPLFNSETYRSNGPIQGIFLRSDASSYMIYGSFTDYKDQASITNTISGVALLTRDGDYIAAASQLKMGKSGFNGPILSAIQLPSGKYLVAGSFTKLDTVSNIYNTTRLNVDGTVETMVVDVVNPDPVNNPNDGHAVVPAFNGGTFGSISKIFYNPATGYTTAIGNFNAHVSTFYERSTKNGPNLDLVEARQLIRMKENGAYDSSYNFDLTTNKSYAGGNGFIYDALQLPDGKLMLVGNFTSFSGTTTNYITSINEADGLPDPTFNNGGSGADGEITRITYNSTTEKILLTGNFKNYNGEPANGIVMINADGSRDASFNFRIVEGGIPNFAGQLKNGKIIVSGSFNKYDGIVRPGLLVLNADGSLASGYNNTGLFRGIINSFVETVTPGGIPGVILVGSFDRFDNKQVGNIIKLRIEN